MKKALSLSLLLFLISSMWVCADPEPSAYKSKSVILMEPRTGKVLFEKEPHNRVSIGSVTKTMLLLLAMEDLESGKLTYDQLITGSPHAKEVGGSTIYLEVGEKMTVDDILKGICINSGNDAAVALAEAMAGSESDCVARMNEKAQELGLQDTHYINVTGLETEGSEEHYSSAYDVAIVAKELIEKHPKVLEYSGIWVDYLRGGRTMLANTNKLLKQYQYTTGLKTGTETNAGYCVVATAKKDDMDLIAVVLGAPDSQTRFDEAQQLLEYGYSNFEVKDVAASGEVVGSMPVVKGEKEQVPVQVANDLTVVIPKTYSDKIKKESTIEESRNAPIEQNAVVGEMVIRAGDEEVGRVNLTTAEPVGKLKFFQALSQVFKAWFEFAF